MKDHGEMAGVFALASSDTKVIGVIGASRLRCKVAPVGVLAAFQLTNVWPTRSVSGW